MTEETDQDHRTEEDIRHGLLYSRVLDGHGGAREVHWQEACDWKPEKPGEVLWIHLDRSAEGIRDWLMNQIGLPEATADLMVSHETHPRAFQEEGALIAVLRGINFNPGAKPEDMISMQLWADEHRVITLRRRRLQSPRDVMKQLDAGNGPKTAGGLVTEIIEQLVARMNRAILDMNDKLDHLEQIDFTKEHETALDDIAVIRRNCLSLKRHMSPQHEALSAIGRDAPKWFSDMNRRDVREVIARLHRYLGDLDVSKESAILIQDDIDSRAASQSNKTMYLLSIVAAIFLPMGFLTGLLGINVGGMPGVDNSHAFTITVIALVAIMLLQLWVFRKLKWL